MHKSGGGVKGDKGDPSDGNLHRMSHSLAFTKMKEEHRRNNSRDNNEVNNNQLAGETVDSNSNTDANYSPEASFNSKKNVHMNALRRRPFDPMTMKSARRKINLQKH